MSTIHRCPGEGFAETISWLCDLMQVDRRTATFLVWDVCFTIGTDRHKWIDTKHATLYIQNNP